MGKKKLGTYDSMLALAVAADGWNSSSSSSLSSLLLLEEKRYLPLFEVDDGGS